MIILENTNSVDSLILQSRSFKNVLKGNDVKYEGQIKISDFNYATIPYNK
jgi:hypothetical protein